MRKKKIKKHKNRVKLKAKVYQIAKTTFSAHVSLTQRKYMAHVLSEDILMMMQEGHILAKHIQ